MKIPYLSISSLSNSAITCAFIVGALSTSGADIAKANNTSNLNVTGAWAGSVVPTNTDVAVWNNQILTAANCTNGPGSDMSWSGIKVLNPPATARINIGSPNRTYRIGASGINLNDPLTTQDFFAGPLLEFTNSQTWNINSLRTFYYNDTADLIGNVTITMNSAGRISGSGSSGAVLRIGSGSSGTATFNQSAGTVRPLRSGSTTVQLNIGRFAGNAGVYNLSGGLLDTDDNGTGVLIRIADEIGADGTLNVSGGQLTAGSIDAGNNGTGRVNISGTGIVTASGTINLPRAAVATGLVNLDGGTLTMGKATALNGGAGTFNFNGGTLKPIAAATDFLQGLTTANVKEGGARIDSSGFDITIAQPLLHGGVASVDGGLTKQGAGTLTLSGAGTFTGPALISGGKLIMTTLHTGGGSVTNSDGATFGVKVATAGTSLKLSALKLGNSSGATIEFNLSVLGNPTAPVIWATNATAQGVNVVNISGVGLTVGQFPLIRSTSSLSSVFSTLSLVGLPQDVVAGLSNNIANSSIDLVVTAAPKLFWTAATSGNWDIITTTNWVDSKTNLTYYTDGYPVVFDDTASNSVVTVVTTVSPGGVLVSNNTLAYSFTGSPIAGGAPLTKQGAGTLTLASPNTYTGDTLINAGKLALGAAAVLPDGAGFGNVRVDGTLDLAGFDETINGFSGAGVIDNTGPNQANFTIGANNSSGSFSGVLQNSVSPLVLTKTGSGNISLTSASSYSGGTTHGNGFLLLGNNSALGTGPLTLSGGDLSSDGNPRTLANNVTITASTSFGNGSSSGLITLNGPVDFGAAARSLTFNSDGVWNGGTSNGGINKLGAGTLTLRGAANWTVDSEVRNGTLIVDGITFVNSQSFRPDCSISLLTARLVVTNGSVVTINAQDGNIRAGYNANVPATNIFDIAGVITMPGATNGQAKMVLGAGCALGIVNLWPGGDAEVLSVNPADVNDLGLSQLNLYGGTLRARASTTAFMQGLTEANVRDGGAVFNTAGFDISVAQLLRAAGSGGVTKSGLGTLTLLGTNTFTGSSSVQQGKLVVSTVHAGGGSFVAQDGASLGTKVAVTGSTLKSSAVTLGVGSGASCAFDLGAGNPSAVPLYATNLTTHGTVTIDVTASGLVPGQFPLIKYDGTIGGSGFAAFTLGILPQGVNASLVNNTAAHTVDLLITSVTPLRWAGNNGTDWDISVTPNWLLGPSSVTYDEASGIGPTVRFDDTFIGTPNVNLPVTVSPASMTVSNNTAPYSISGAGKITGTTGLTKQGSGTLTLATAGNNYAGTTAVQNGKLLLTASEVLPEGPGKGDVVVSGSLDLSGTTETINGLSGAGTIDNSGGGNATLVVGSNDVSSAFTGVVGGTAGTVGLRKVGTGAFTLSANNSFAGGTIVTNGQLRLGHDHALGVGSLTMAGGTVSSDSTTARNVTNAVFITAACTLGDAVNNGLLTLSGPMDLNNGARNLTVASPLVYTGFSSNGRLNKSGSGTLTIKGVVNWNGDAEARNGTLILDGAMVTNTGAVRPDSDQGFGSARMIITNGSVLVLDFATANLRASQDGDVTATNYLDVAGTVRMPSATTGNGRFIAGRDGITGIINVYPGADVAISAVTSSSAHGEFHFHGGILRGTVDSSAFIGGIDLVDIGTGGLTIDSAGWQLAIPQPLLAGVGSGGLTKIGSGVLALNSTNTYTGTTLVSAGILAGTGIIAGPVNVSASGTLSPGSPVGTLTVNNTVTLGGTTLAQISRTGATLTNGLLIASTLNCGGVLVVTNIGPDALAPGDTFNLFDATTFNGSFTSFVLPVVSGATWDTTKVTVDGTISLVAAVQFAGISLSGSTLTLSGNGGSANGTYYLLGSTNVTAPANNWLPLQTNLFDGSGNFSTTVTVNPANPKQFFRLFIP